MFCSTNDGKESPVSGTSTPIGAFEGASSENSSVVDAPVARDVDPANNSAAGTNGQISSNSYSTSSASYPHGQDSSNHPQLPQGPVPNQREDPEGYARYYEQWQAYYHWYYQYYNYPDNSNENQQYSEVNKPVPSYGKTPAPPVSQHPSNPVQAQTPDVPPPGVDGSTERLRAKGKRNSKERVASTVVATVSSEPTTSSQAS